MRATPEISGAPGLIRTRDRVRREHGEGEGPDRWAPPVGGKEERKGWEAGLGRGKGVGRRVEVFWAAGKKRERERERAGEMVFWAAGKKRKEKRKRRDGPAGLKWRGEKGRLFHF